LSVSTPAETATVACCTTSRVTRFTRATGDCFRADGRFDAAALRVDFDRPVARDALRPRFADFFAAPRFFVRDAFREPPRLPVLLAMPGILLK